MDEKSEKRIEVRDRMNESLQLTEQCCQRFVASPSNCRFAIWLDPKLALPLKERREEGGRR